VDDVEVKRDFGKIIRRVAENTAIDKKYVWIFSLLDENI
jgi:hypothetical protein